jgi:hypothetical protein
MTKFKKGDKVYAIAPWNNFDTFHVQEIEIQSWGKKQGTATRAENGEFIKSQIWVENANQHWRGCFYFKVGTIEPQQKALELAQEYIKQSLIENEGRVGHEGSYQPIILREIEKFKSAKPLVIFR